MDLRSPEGLVGVDVADARQRALREELRLDARPAPSQAAPEATVVERLVPRLRSLGGQRGERPVLPCRHHREGGEDVVVGTVPLGEALHQEACDVHECPGVVPHQGVEVLLGQTREFRVPGGPHGGGARLAGDHGHLAYGLAAGDLPEGTFRAVVAFGQDLEPAAEHDVHVVCRVPLPHQVLPAHGEGVFEPLVHVSQVHVLQSVEERCLGQEFVEDV